MIRPELQAKIISELLPSEAQEEPVLYSVAGIPSAGKTTYLNIQYKDNKLPVPHYYHDPDRVMEAVPDYWEDYEEMGPIAAFEKWQMPARYLADEILFELALKKQVHIILDMGLARDEIIQMIQKATKFKYKILLRFIWCSVDEAMKRKNLRGRFTPKEMIAYRAKFLTQNIDKILTLPNELEAFDNGNLNKPYIPLTIEELKERLSAGT